MTSAPHPRPRFSPRSNRPLTPRFLRLAGLLLGFSLLLNSARAESRPTNTAQLRQDVGYLASDELEGRLTGSPGAHAAAEYIAARFQAAGLLPGSDHNTFFQSFDFSAGVEIAPDRNTLALTRSGTGVGADHADATPLVFAPDTDFRPLAFSASGDVAGQVVFVGYGLTVPGKLGEGYDSYAGNLDVTDKIVVAFRYVPEAVAPERRAELNRYAGLRYKALVARNHGAKALLIVTGPNSPHAGELVPTSFDSSSTDSGILVAAITARVADALLSGTGTSLSAMQTTLDNENPHAPEVRFTPPGVELHLTTHLTRLTASDRNVLGVIPPGSNATEYILLGAHYDHLGHGEIGGFGIKGEENQIHNGADDNASGVAALFAIATQLAADRHTHPDPAARGILFAAWSGEEMGLLGSTHFAEHPVLPLANIAAYLNFDMVGRLRSQRLIIQGVGSSSQWPQLITSTNQNGPFTITLQDDPYLPTDTTAFYPKHIPVLAFFTGSHDDYHRPSDDPDTLNYEGLAQIAAFAGQLTQTLSTRPDRPDYIKITQTNDGGSRDGLRVYLGTIPNYTAEVRGVKLTGVRGASPADQAGLRADDVVVELGGQVITNIYDYTYALDAVRIGQPTPIVVERNGQRVELTIVPGARP